MKHIPNLFTLLNLLFGCLAIVYILQTGFTLDADGQYFAISEKMGMAALFIGLAAVVDFLDGFVARLFKADSEMGKQLDSLADLVSFGVAPSLIVFQFLKLSYVSGPHALNTSMIWLMPAFLIALAGAWRLARYNLSAGSSVSFQGVPIPAVGLLIASLPLIYWHAESRALIDVLLNKWFLYLLILLVSWLMISKIPLMALKFNNFSLKSNLPKIVLLIIAILAILFFQWIAVPVIFIAYIILSLLFKNQIA